ncbi:hypothetical protein QBC46DRAFT_161620 [Diplogelasinospora grovesii]|uniref:Uncharacterized protein n=1 Tax=Diplogelasinospora grovesii TaxID=303347 RepID=A0AAN6N3R6_9PEZI|nr:hypothetical protein QBC46DRAFT_161620 [Diplogelasinospora grovesii]
MAPRRQSTPRKQVTHPTSAVLALAPHVLPLDVTLLACKVLSREENKSKHTPIHDIKMPARYYPPRREDPFENIHNWNDGYEDLRRDKMPPPPDDRDDSWAPLYTTKPRAGYEPEPPRGPASRDSYAARNLYPLPPSDEDYGRHRRPPRKASPPPPRRTRSPSPLRRRDDRDRGYKDARYPPSTTRDRPPREPRELREVQPGPAPARTKSFRHSSPAMYGSRSPSPRRSDRGHDRSPAGGRRTRRRGERERERHRSPSPALPPPAAARIRARDLDRDLGRGRSQDRDRERSRPAERNPGDRAASPRSRSSAEKEPRDRDRDRDTGRDKDMGRDRERDGDGGRDRHHHRRAARSARSPSAPPNKKPTTRPSVARAKSNPAMEFKHRFENLSPRWQKAAAAAFQAGSLAALEMRAQPGAWKGEKGARVATAALGAAALDAFKKAEEKESAAKGGDKEKGGKKKSDVEVIGGAISGLIAEHLAKRNRR